MCQLAITEVQHTDITVDMVTVPTQLLTSKTRIHDQRIGFGVGITTDENLELVHQLREEYLESQLPETIDVDSHVAGGTYSR